MLTGPSWAGAGQREEEAGSLWVRHAIEEAGPGRRERGGCDQPLRCQGQCSSDPVHSEASSPFPGVCRDAPVCLAVCLPDPGIGAGRGGDRSRQCIKQTCPGTMQHVEAETLVQTQGPLLDDVSPKAELKMGSERGTARPLGTRVMKTVFSSG